MSGQEQQQPTPGAGNPGDLDSMMVGGLQQFSMESPESTGPAGAPAGADQGTAEPEGEGPKGEPQAGAEPGTPTPDETAEQKFQRLQGKSQKLEQENARLAREKKELEDKLAETKAREEKEALDKQFITTATEVNKQALQAIDALDPDTPGYQDQVAGIWATANQRIAQIQVAAPPAHQPTAAAPADQRVDAGKDQDTASAEAVEAARNEMTRACAAAKIDPTDRVFLSFASEAPDNLPFNEQLQWAITETKKIKDAERSRLLQEMDLPLDRGGGGRPAGSDSTAPSGPVSLDAAIESANHSRRI